MAISPHFKLDFITNRRLATVKITTTGDPFTADNSRKNNTAEITLGTVFRSKLIIFLLDIYLVESNIC